MNGTANGTAWPSCDRGALVGAQLYTSSHTCDGYVDCRSGEDELWALLPDGARGAPCAGGGAASAGALRCAAWIALAAVACHCAWALAHRREPEARLFAWPFAAPFLAGCLAGPIATLLLAAAGGGPGGGGGLLDDRQCAAPLVLSLGATAALGALVLLMWRTLRLTGQTLQVQMAPTPPRAATPLGIALALPAAASAVGAAVDPWRTRSIGGAAALTSGVRCAGEGTAAAAVVFWVNAAVVGLLLVIGVWLALGPARIVAVKFRFYPWMQELKSVADAFVLWFVCAVASAVSALTSDSDAYIPALHAGCFAYNFSVILSLPVLWVPKVAAIMRARQAKHERVTALHSLISGSEAPCVVDRGTGTLAQGRFRRSSRLRPSRARKREAAERPAESRP